MSCCDAGENPPTVRHLIHDLSSPWVDQGKPVTVFITDSAGAPLRFAVTGVTTSARGQSLQLRQVEL